MKTQKLLSNLKKDFRRDSQTRILINILEILINPKAVLKGEQIGTISNIIQDAGEALRKEKPATRDNSLIKWSLQITTYLNTCR